MSDVSSDSRYINAIDTVRSELAVPLMYKGKAIGVLDIQSPQLDYFTKEQQTYFDAAGEPAGDRD